MNYSDLLSYEQITDNLRSCVDNGKFPHALLFTEKEGYGAFTIAWATIRYLFCKSRNNGDSCGICPSCKQISKLAHPDLHFIFPTNTSSLIGKDKKPEISAFYPLWRELALENPYFSEQELYNKLGIENKLGIIGVAEVNTIIGELSLSACEGGPRVTLIMFPERMNTEASNKLLKSLEEPKPDTFFILISQNPTKIIPTILSRCRIIEVPPMEQKILASRIKEECDISIEEALFWSKYSGGSYGKAKKMAKNREESDENFVIITNMLNFATKKDLPSLCDCWEQLSMMGKESQKQLCLEALEILRKLYVLSLGMEEIAYIPPKERETYSSLSKEIKKDFYAQGFTLFNSAIDSIERNVNSKFIFCDLCNRIYYYI